MSLPPLAPIPPATIRLQLAPEEWEASLDAWLTLTNFYQRLPSKELLALSTPESSVVDFLLSFYHESAGAESGDGTFRNLTAQKLKKTCFGLVQRICKEPSTATQLLDYSFLANVSRVHSKSAALSEFMNDLWKQHEKIVQKSLVKTKAGLIQLLDSSSDEAAKNNISALSSLMLASPEAAVVFMTGSDFLDALASTYGKSKATEERKIVTAVAYIGLQSLTQIDPPNISMLTDHLYGLKAQADRSTDSPSLLADLVTNTSLTSKLRRSAGGIAADRLLKCLDLLETYRSPSIALPRKHAHQKPRRGKAKALDGDHELHMYRMSLVTQIQDLFPDLGSGFVLKLLDEYNGDVEQATAHLLDNSLPAHLENLDRTEPAPILESSQEKIERLAPRTTPPPVEPETFIPERRNVFDDDEFDRLEFDTSRLHIGKRTERPSSEQPNKAAILSALAAFDSDDDERDDTYDVDDVGGTVDTSHPDGEPGPSSKVTQEENDMALFTAYKSAPELFGRTFDIRKGQARQALKSETGMTDEAVEGWAIMLQRDPKRLSRLEAQFGSFDGKQAELARTSYRESPGGTETEESDAQPTARGAFGGRGRGRGRGGNAAGPSSDPNTASAQRRKEANKSSRANHNRRDQRARKMARGGFPG